MSLLDELRSILSHHRNHVLAQTNQGTARLVEDHLARLEHAVDDGEAHRVLGELYSALDAPAPAEPAPPVADSVSAAPDAHPFFGAPEAAEPAPDEEHEHPDGAV